MNILLVFLFLFVLPLPGTLLGLLRPGKEDGAENLIDAFALGMALSLCGLYLCAYVSIDLFQLVWAAALLAAGFAYLERRAAARSRNQWSSKAKVLCWLIAGYFALRVLPVFFEPYPHGWDPYFHLVLADKIAQAKTLIGDWTPYETIPLSYPLGSHLIVALASSLLAIPLHEVFSVALAFFTAVCAALTYAVVSRATARRDLGLYAAATYAFMAVNGSLDYARWGGLPSLIGECLFLGLLSFLLQEELASWWSRGALAALFVGLSLTNQHTAVMATLTLGWMLAFFFLKGDRARGLRIFQGLVAAALLGAPYFWHTLRHAPPIRDTSLLTYMEKLVTPKTLFFDLGPAFSIAVFLGGVLCLFRKVGAKVSPILSQALAGVLACFVAAEYGSRLVSIQFFGKDLAPFTPSRFLTDAVPLLSLFAALFFSELRRFLRVGPGLVLGLILACFAVNLGAYRAIFRPAVPRDRLSAFAWLRKHAAADALIMDSSFAASYLTRRPSSEMPIPSSESRKTATIRPLALELKRSGGRVPPGAGTRQIVLLYAGDAKVPPQRVLWAHPSGLRAVQLNP